MSLRARLLVGCLLVAGCGGPQRPRYVDPDRPDQSRALPVVTVLGQPASAPEFQALIAASSATMTATGEDRAWTVRGRDFDCVYGGSAPGGEAAPLTEVRDVAGPLHQGRAARRAALPGATAVRADLGHRVAALQPPHDDPRPPGAHRGAPAVAGPDRARASRAPAAGRRRVHPAPAPRHGDAAAAAAGHRAAPRLLPTYADIRAKLAAEGYTPRTPRKVALIPPPGRNLASATLPLEVVVGRRYTVLVWTTFATGPMVAVRTSPSASRAADIAPHGSTATSGMAFILGFRGLQPTAEVLLSAREASVHTAFYVVLFEQTGAP